MLRRRHTSVQDVPTCELSVLFEIILHQALKQTGETTRACRFCLQVLNFLQMEGWRNNKGLLLRDTSPLFQKFTEFPYNWYPGPY